MSKVIPTIPPLSSIQDPNTRAVLQALVNGWQVRNGDAGTGEHKFLTEADLKDQAEAYTRLTATSLARGGGDKGPSKVGAVAALIQAMVDSVTQSRAWKLLGERIDWIDTPAWLEGRLAGVRTEIQEVRGDTYTLAQKTDTAVSAFNQNSALVQQQITALTTADASTASAITTLQTNVSDVRTSAQQAFSLATTVDGKVRGAWTVKFDAQGYVTGFGLTLEGKPDNYRSDFAVRADRFFIGSPQGSGIAEVAPFIVTTTPTTVDGVLMPPGIYMSADLYGASGTFSGTLAAATGTFTGTLSAATVDTGTIKVGSSGMTFVDRDSGIEVKSTVVLSQFGATTGNLVTAKYALDNLKCYFPLAGSSTPVGSRLRSGSVTINLVMSGTIDHYMSLWYRTNGGAWVHINQVTEPQQDRGTGTVVGSVTLNSAGTSTVEFAVSATDSAGAYADAGKTDIRNYGVTLTAVNF